MKLEKIKEYLSLIPKGIKNIDKIVEGHINNIRLKNGGLLEDQQNEILRRRIICSACPFMSKNAKDSQEYFNLVGNHYESYRGNEHCSLCSCPIDTKTASMKANCGIKTWNEENKDKQMELKWKSYE